MAIIAQIFVPTSVIFDSLKLFSLFFLGAVIGYLLTDAFCKRYLETGKVKSIVLKNGPWKLHLHHWLTGAAFVLVINFLGFTLPIFLLGLMDGLIMHDIIYKDKKYGIKWYNVIYKRNIENN
jgi:hypothetical protein